jgi:hypothetical protein
MTPKLGYKGPQLPPLPVAKNIKGAPQPTGKQDTNLKLAAQQIARNNKMKLARAAQPSTTATKPIMGGTVSRPSQDAMRQAFASQGVRPYNTKPTGPVASPSQMISTLANKASAPSMPMKKGGKVSSASSRADGCVMKGKTKGKII